MESSEKKSRIFLKRYTVPIIIILVLIIARLLLPYFLKRYVNKTLDDIPGYTGYVKDIDVALLRGAYVIDGLILKKEDRLTETPILDFEKSDISIEWRALWKGRIVSEIILHNPKFNYVTEDQSSETEAGVEDWTKALKDLVPIDINHLAIHNGSANFAELNADPPIELFLNEIQLQATNLSNVVNEDLTLPSNLTATAVSIGGGAVSLNGDLNLLKKIPDVDINFELQKANVTALNDLISNVAGVDFESGTFELYSEVAIADGYLKGYLKPMFINTKILGEDDKGFFEKLWEGFVGVFKFLLKNKGTDTLATRAPIEGNLNEDLDTGLFTTILNIFKNGWISAFSGEVDENIEYEDAARKDKE